LSSTNSQDPETVARLANIPQGTSLVSQGTAKSGTIPLVFPTVDITPFVIGQPANLIHFPGTSNIAFLTGAGDKPNAQAAQMDATFWISDFVDPKGNPGLQLQYSQRVLLNFNGLTYPLQRC
jgi:hypothetical protein